MSIELVSSMELISILFVHILLLLHGVTRFLDVSAVVRPYEPFLLVGTCLVSVIFLGGDESVRCLRASGSVKIWGFLVP